LGSNEDGDEDDDDDADDDGPCIFDGIVPPLNETI